MDDNLFFKNYMIISIVLNRRLLNVESNFRRHKIKSYKSYLKTKIDLDSPNWDEREVFMS